MTQPIDIAEGIVTELRALLPGDVPVERRYCPIMDRTALAGKRVVTVYWESAERTAIMRGTFRTKKNVFGIAVQTATKSAVRGDSAKNDITLGDSVMELAEQIVDQWLPGGLLFRKQLADANCEQEPILELPDPLIIAQLGVYTAIVGVTYQYSGD